jgi:hypothetical protein
MTDREKIIKILINHSTTSCNDDEIIIKVIFQEQFNRIAYDILPLLEKRDEIIASLKQQLAECKEDSICKHCRKPMKLISETPDYLCMNPECDNYININS